MAPEGHLVARAEGAILGKSTIFHGQLERLPLTTTGKDTEYERKR